MHTITIPEALYSRVQEEAADTGMSVTAFVLGLIEESLRPGERSYDHLFTPEVLAELDAAAAEARNGRVCSPAEVSAFLVKTKEEWLKARSG